MQNRRMNSTTKAKEEKTKTSSAIPSRTKYSELLYYEENKRLRRELAEKEIAYVWYNHVLHILIIKDVPFCAVRSV